jgi:hypothetical protein
MEAKKQLVSVQKQRKSTKRAGRGKPFEKGNTAGFKPGQSGNPGGLPKGTPKVKVALLNLLGLSPDELVKFKPATVAEALALKQVNRALGSGDVQVRDSILATEKIADRTEGKATEHKEITGKDGKSLFECTSR